MIVALPGLFSYLSCSLPHNIQVIVNSFITVNNFSELLEKLDLPTILHRKIRVPIYLVAEVFSD